MCIPAKCLAVVLAASAVVLTSAPAQANEGYAVIAEVALVVGGVAMIGGNLHNIGQDSASDNDVYRYGGYTLGGVNALVGALLLAGGVHDDDDTIFYIGVGQLALGVVGLATASIDHATAGDAAGPHPALLASAVPANRFTAHPTMTFRF